MIAVISLTTLIYARMNAPYPSFILPGNAAFILPCLHEVAEGMAPGRVTFNWD